MCFTCHRSQRVRFMQRSHHPLRENRMACSECHNLHGDNGNGLKLAGSVREQCTGCHAEKRGPFLWEHEPVTEDCAACHVPHGSNNAALLRHRGPFLCQQCHQNVGRLAGHINQKREFGVAGNARFLFGANCMNCHSQVHGSNHPSGVALTR